MPGCFRVSSGLANMLLCLHDKTEVFRLIYRIRSKSECFFSCIDEKCSASFVTVLSLDQWRPCIANRIRQMRLYLHVTMQSFTGLFAAAVRQRLVITELVQTGTFVEEPDSVNILVPSFSLILGNVENRLIRSPTASNSPVAPVCHSKSGVIQQLQVCLRHIGKWWESENS